MYCQIIYKFREALSAAEEGKLKMKRHRRLTAILLSMAMMLTSLVIPVSIHAAESDGTIQAGVPFSGTISDELKPTLFYWSDRTTKEDPYYQGEQGNEALTSMLDQNNEQKSCYSEYSLTVDTTGFYFLNYSDETQMSSYIVIDSENVQAANLYSDEGKYLYLQAGKSYRVIAYLFQTQPCSFNLTVSYLGSEISGLIPSIVYDSAGNEIGWDNTRLSWTLNMDGLLTIQGQGDLFNEMGSYWDGLGDIIKEVEIKEGITSIEYEQFASLSSLEKVTVPSSVKKIENEAFWNCKALREIIFNGDAPRFVETVFEEGDSDCNIFYSVTAMAYYPAGNSSWTADVRQNYGGNITWAPKELEPGSYYDVSENAWYYEAVKYAGENSLMSGVGGGKFALNTETNRAMMVTILHRMEGAPQADDAAFSDVASGSYYADAVAWASSEGIVSGYSETLFAPNDPITREQMAAILYRYAEYKGYDISISEDLSAFRDSDNIASYAEEAMSWAVGAGLISGTDSSALTPSGTATRAQIAAILMRFSDAFVVK